MIESNYEFGCLFGRQISTIEHNRMSNIRLVVGCLRMIRFTKRNRYGLYLPLADLAMEIVPESGCSF